MTTIDVWTGRHASALKRALRHTNDSFAQVLGTAVRTVAKWGSDPDRVPSTELQRALDTLLQRAPADARDRFMQLLVNVERHPPVAPAQIMPGDRLPTVRAREIAVPVRLLHDAHVDQLMAWIDAAADWMPGEARSRTAEMLARLDAGALADRARRRGLVDRRSIAVAVHDFYGCHPLNGHAMYTASLDGDPVETSLLTRANWLDLRLPLGSGADHFSLSEEPQAKFALDEPTAAAAVNRLAEVLATDTRCVNSPLYQLRQVKPSNQTISGEFGLASFAAYALTIDLLENELLDAILTGQTHDPAAMPLRHHYLPDLAAVLDIRGRLCAGGPLALLAAARPSSRSRPSQPDYVFLVQERSARTLNAGRRLAVIPKGFHQPLADFSDDAQLAATLERELEEELLGRSDLDSTASPPLIADPLHLNRLSAPMRWLIDRADPATWQMDCTGFGYNLVSGNYEFASLIVIHDEAWWQTFGDRVEANWEAAGLRRYSTRDRQGLRQLVHDGAWSNEGLFALLQGLRRLAEVGEGRVDTPTIDLELT